MAHRGYTTDLMRSFESWKDVQAMPVPGRARPWLVISCQPLPLSNGSSEVTFLEEIYADGFSCKHLPS